KDLTYYSEPFILYYWEFVGKLAHRYTRKHEDAEDIRQQAFMSVLRALKGKSAQEVECVKLRGYLHMAIRNCSINMHRGKDKYWLAESLDALLEDFILRETLIDEKRERQPEAALEDKEFGRLVGELLNTLPSRQRMAVTLRHGLRLSYPEIARFMQISVRAASHLV